MKISRQFGLAALACSALLASSANAAVHTLGSAYPGLFIGDTVTFNTFASQPGPVSYTNPAGTVKVEYVGDVFGVFNNHALDPADKSWAVLGGNGYTSITLTGNYGVEAMSFDFAQTFAEAFPSSAFYQVLGLNGAVLGIGEITGIRYKAYDNITAYYDGALITGFNIYSDSSIFNSFSPTGNTDSGLLDHVFVTDRIALPTLGGAVPEPTTWAMLLLGFAGIGAMLRSRRKQMVPATA